MQNSNDIIVSEGDNEFLRLVRENRERRYANDTTNTTKQDTSDIDSTRVDNAQEQGDTGASKRASSRRNIELPFLLGLAEIASRFTGFMILLVQRCSCRCRFRIMKRQSFGKAGRSNHIFPY